MFRQALYRAGISGRRMLCLPANHPAAVRNQGLHLVPPGHRIRAQRLLVGVGKTETQLEGVSDENADDFDRDLALKSIRECFSEYKDVLAAAESEATKRALEEALRDHMLGLQQKAQKSFYRRFDIGWTGVF